VSIVSKFYLFDLNLDKFLTKKVLQNLDFFNNLVDILYIATSFGHNIVRKNYK